MNSGRTLFPQLMEFVVIDDFRACVRRYNGHYKVQGFWCWDQYLAMSMDRAYLDFARLYRLHQNLAFFVIRPKSNFNYRSVYSHAFDDTTGVRCDAARDQPQASTECTLGIHPLTGRG